MGDCITLMISFLCMAFCCAFWIFLLLAIVGFFLLRRRGAKKVTVKEAVSAGAASVSQVFVRGKAGLEDLDDEDED